MREKQIKHYFNVTAIGFFAYALLLQFLSAGTVLLLESLFPSQNTDSMYYAMSITVLLCLGFLSFLFRHSYKEEALENREAEPVSPSFTPLRFLHYFFLFCGAQWVSALGFNVLGNGGKRRKFRRFSYAFLYHSSRPSCGRNGIPPCPL